MLVFAGIAWADKEMVQLTKEGQAAARATLIKRSDLGRLVEWTGGMDKPDYLGDAVLDLPSQQSDPVLNGSA